MRSSASSRPVRGPAALGSVNWAFVVTLFLLLGFIFLWYQAADDRDGAKKERDKAKADKEVAMKEGNAIKDELEKDIQQIGFLKDKALTWNGSPIAGIDREAIQQHFLANGMVPDASRLDANNKPTQVPGMWNLLTNHLTLKIPVAMRSGENPAATAKEFTFKFSNAKFRDAIKVAVDAAAKVPPYPPEPPADSDDVKAKEEYAKKRKEYDDAIDALKKAMEALTGPEFAQDWKDYKAAFGVTLYDPDKTALVELNFGSKQPEPKNLQDLLTKFQLPFDTLLTEFKVNKEADRQVIDRANADLKASQANVEADTKKYGELQKQMETEVAKQKDEADKARAQAATNEAAKNQAENALQTALGESKKTVAKLTGELSAAKARISSEKEHADLEIRRDEVDGHLLAVSNELETGSIDLGSNDKVYPGLKFVVSYVDRGGARQPKGEVQVIKVTGPHSAQVRVVSRSMDFSSGDLISNPLFNANREIHVYPVSWTPDLLQKRRLDEMHVIVDEQPSARTDYFVVPDDWKGGSAAAAPKAEGGAEAPAAAATSPLDKARSEANTFGATVITRRMLESFLKL